MDHVPVEVSQKLDIHLYNCGGYFGSVAYYSIAEIGICDVVFGVLFFGEEKGSRGLKV